MLDFQLLYTETLPQSTAKFSSVFPPRFSSYIASFYFSTSYSHLINVIYVTQVPYIYAIFFCTLKQSERIFTVFIVKNFVDMFANSCLFTLFLLFQKINQHPSAKLNLKSWNSVVPIWEPSSDNFLLFLHNFLQFKTDPDLILVPNTIRIIYFGYKMLQLNMLWSIFLFIQSPQSSLFKELIPLIPSQIPSGFPPFFFCLFFIYMITDI